MSTQELSEELVPSTLKRQAGRGFLRLRFAPELEIRYREHDDQRSHSITRLAMLLAFALVFSFVLMDHFALGARFNTTANLVLLGVACPMLALAAVLGYVLALARHLQVLVLLDILVVGLVFIVVWVVMPAREVDITPPYAYEAMILFTVFAYFFSGLRYWLAVGLGFCASVAFLVTQTWVGLSGATLLYTGFFLIGANAMGALGCYALEKLRRREFIAQASLEYLAERDPLTDLVNRRALHTHIEKAWAQAVRDGKAVGVMLLDIDKFKQINDEKGHEHGDQCLLSVAQVLRSNARRPLDIAARYGGDEFVVFWYAIEALDMRIQVDRVLQQVRASDLQFTVSIGASQCMPNPEQSMQDLLRVADYHMYQSKHAGRDRATLTSES